MSTAERPKITPQEELVFTWFTRLSVREVLLLGRLALKYQIRPTSRKPVKNHPAQG